jgi:hypothetical protein
MHLRRIATITVLAVICLFATPTRESTAQAACWYPWSHVTTFWYPNSCGNQPWYPGQQCLDVLTWAGETHVECDQTTWSIGDTNPALYQSHEHERCPQVCE